MARREGFGSGFLLGSIAGAIVGGLVGAALVARKEENNNDGSGGDLFQAPVALDSEGDEADNRGSTPAGARRSLEEKISQINLAIEDVRQRLNGDSTTALERESQQ